MDKVKNWSFCDEAHHGQRMRTIDSISSSYYIFWLVQSVSEQREILRWNQFVSGADWSEFSHFDSLSVVMAYKSLH